MADLDTFPERLAHVRHCAGLTQAELAARLGKHRSTIANLERGESGTTIPQLAAFAAALGVTAGWLAAGETADAPVELVSELRRIRNDWQATVTSNRVDGWPEHAERVAIPARIVAQLDLLLTLTAPAQTRQETHT